MFENDWKLFKLQLKMIMQEKIVFFYTLIVPIIMAFLNNNLNFRGNEVLYIYWAYIVVTTVLNGFLMNLIRVRESGFFKQPSELIDSNFSILFTAFFAQLLVIQIQIFIFNLTIDCFITPVSSYTFLYGFLVSFLTTIISISMMSILLLFKCKQRTFYVIINFFLFGGLLLLSTRPEGVWNYILTMINPFQFIYALYSVPCIINSFSLILGVFTICYMLIGIIVLSRLTKKNE
ncbi:hypothetical protein [Companilactobacillus paralimentarius]|nr:hypothetical protein [Companilactobacillus paralimentarius]KAE9565425.1 hypothetical protein ATN96_03555 [Companilactobacillus paralimentarius]QFR70072.1 hypothetical protein LP238_10130 [Companilactobacillus paralimentarius]